MGTNNYTTSQNTVPAGPGDVQAAIDYVAENGMVELLDVGDGVQLASVPRNRQLCSIKKLIDEYLERPERKTGFATLTTLDAFCDYVNRHKDSAQAVVFLDDRDPSAPKLRAIFNAHEQTARGSDGSVSALVRGQADWQDFGAEYAFPLSPEWQTWTELPSTFSQADFAAFLEDRIVDVTEPGESVRAFAKDVGAALADAARLLELSRGLAVHVDGRVAQAVNLGTGEHSVTFEETHKDASGAPLKVPGAFAIGIPVFRLGALYQLPVRLRYRAGNGKLTWSLAVQRADKAFDLALDEAAKRVAATTGVPLFRGGL